MKRLFGLALSCLALLGSKRASAQASVFLEPLNTKHPLEFSATAGAAADFDGNGRVDVAYLGNRKIHVALWRQSSGLDVRQQSLAGRALQAQAADLDLDGIPDLACLSATSVSRTVLELFRNDGKAQFTSTRFITSLAPIVAFAIADVDGDRGLDVVLACRGQNRLFLAQSNGQYLDATSRLAQIADPSLCVALVDVDGDGDLDLYTGTERAQDRLWLNDGRGRFGIDATSRLASTLRGSTRLAFGDVNADGKLDLVRGNPSDLHLGDGRGGFVKDTRGRMPTWRGSDPVLTDFDGDKDLDLSLAVEGAANQIWINDGRGFFANESAKRMPRDSALTKRGIVADLDADGDSDLFFVDASRPASTVVQRSLRNDGRGFFSVAEAVRDRRELPRHPDKTHALVPFDANGDGFLDLIVGRTDAEPNSVLINDTFGRFVPDTTGIVPVHRESTNAMQLAEMDGDAATELVCVNWNAPQLRVLDWNGSRFTTVKTVSVPRANGNALAIGDLNGDKINDVIIGHWRHRNTLLFGDGRGGFVDLTSTHMWPVSEGTVDLDLIDIDGDGDLDLLEVAEKAKLHIYINDVGGSLMRHSTIGLPAVAGNACVADFDGDGDVDIFVGSLFGRADYFLENRTTARVLRFTTHNVPKLLTSLIVNDDTRRVLAEDMDGDGDIDVVAASDPAKYRGWFHGRERVYQNNGRGIFSVRPVQSPNSGIRQHSTKALVAADFDRDGDTDILTGLYSTPNEYFVNARRQIRAAQSPSIGRVFAVDNWSLPWSPRSESYARVLLASPRTIAAPAPGFGLLRLDPSSLFQLSTVTAPAGQATWRLPIPNDKKLLGAKLYFQGLVQGRDQRGQLGLQLTNALREVIR